MRQLMIAAVLLAAAGCAPVGPGRPEAVTVSEGGIVVRMSTGERCLGPLSDETRTGTGWAGRLQGCAADYPYEVALQAGANPLRLVLESALGALGGEGLLAPRAQVVITGPGGRVWRFRSPPSEEPRATSAER
jgi:hypothetical protein